MHKKCFKAYFGTEQTVALSAVASSVPTIFIYIGRAGPDISAGVTWEWRGVMMVFIFLSGPGA